MQDNETPNPAVYCSAETVAHALYLEDGQIKIEVIARQNGAVLYRGRPAGLLRLNSLRWEQKSFKALLSEIIRFGCLYRVAEFPEEV